jgi:hypothetical protein
MVAATAVLALALGVALALAPGKRQAGGTPSTTGLLCGAINPRANIAVPVIVHVVVH